MKKAIQTRLYLFFFRDKVVTGDIMNFLKKQEEYIKKTLEKMGYQTEKVVLTPSSRPDLGEYQYNGIMALAKNYSKNPVEMANALIEELKDEREFEAVTVAGPGFINITFSKKSLINLGNKLLSTKEYVEKLPSKKIIIDYGGPNVAKVLHVGHLRSANIGEALKRLARKLGYEVIGDVHLGDYGLQMGMVMLEIQTKYPNLSCFQENFQDEYVNDLPITNDDLIDLYPLASRKAKESPEIMEKARHITYLLQQNHKGYKALWRSILKISLEDIKNIYQKLSVDFDLWLGESDAEKLIPAVMDHIRNKKLTKMSEGAEIIEVTTNNDKLPIPPLLLVKSNQTVSYETTDLATLWQREHDFHPDEVWYVVDKRQELHFTQVFRAAKKTEIINESTNLEFIGFGTMNGSDGKPFKTRSGGVMSLRELMKIVKVETEKNMIPSITGKEREELSEVIAIGTMKFADLLSHRATDYIFDPEKFCDANGKTGPFIMYSTIRMRSLLQKAQEANLLGDFKILKGNSDKKVLLHILNLQKVLENALQEKSLHEITDYLYNLNNTYNNFYSENRILTESDKDLQQSWIALTKLTYEINVLLLDILAIEIPARM